MPSCEYCGRQVSTRRRDINTPKQKTTDHVPPRSFFFGGGVRDPITVVSCRKCNGGKHDDEDFFKVILLCSGAAESVAGFAAWNDPKFIRGLTRERGLGKEVQKRLFRLPARTLAGLHIGVPALHISDRDNSRLERVVNYNVRALYRFESGRAMSKDVPVFSLLLSDNAKPLFERTEYQTVIRALSPGKKEWPGYFEYRYLIDDESGASAWLLRYFDFAFFFASTHGSVGERLVPEVVGSSFHLITG